MAIPKPNRSFDLDPPAAGRRRAPAWRRWWPALAAAPLALVLLGWALLGGAREPGPGTRLAEVMQGDLVLGIDGYGKLVPADLVSIGSRSGGRIARIERRTGSRVGKGEVIVALENAELLQKLREAEKSLAQAKVDLMRNRADMTGSQHRARSRLADLQGELRVSRLEIEGLRKLAEARIVTPIELEKSIVHGQSLERQIADAGDELRRLEALGLAATDADRAVMDALSKDVQRLREEVADLEVRAPRDATIFDMPATLTVGSQVEPGAVVATLATGDGLAVELWIPASRSGEVAPGQPATVELAGKQYEATVARVDPQVVRGELKVLLPVEGLAAGSVFAGQPVTGRIITGRLHDAIYVARPANATPHHAGSVLVATGDPDAPARREVRFGAADAEHVQLLAGAVAGERIFLDAAAAAD